MNKLVDKLLQITRGGLSLHNINHLLSNLSDLRGLRICSPHGLILLRLVSLGEAHAEDSQGEIISGLHVDVCFNKSLLLLDEKAVTVSGEIHAMEAREARRSLDLLTLQLDLSVRKVLSLHEIRQGNFKHSTLQAVGGDLGSLRLRYERLSDVTDLKVRRRLHVIPVLLQKRITNALLCSLSLLRQPLVLTHCHLGSHCALLYQAQRLPRSV
mmetsp:Transcript_5849/g.17546  ORF Transcript_5849/g.17546 Transcript_5849/m.17546 type:complete len:212 (+) Transcript_5849:300-935(+)